MLTKKEIRKLASEIKKNINSCYPNLSTAYAKTRIGNPVLVKNWLLSKGSSYYIVPILKNKMMIGAMALGTDGHMKSIGILGTPIPCFLRKLTKEEEYVWIPCVQTKNMWFPLIHKRKKDGTSSFEDYKGIKYPKITYNIRPGGTALGSVQYEGGGK